MKSKISRVFLVILLSFILNPAWSQEKSNSGYYTSGKVMESLSFQSKILGKEVKYSIYLPSDYDNSTRQFPVVYLLHGYTDNETAWVQFGEVNLSADRAIADRRIPPMIIVMPDAGVTWYINDVLGKVKYEDMFFQELIPYMEKTYRIRQGKEFRGISGLSMGGYGALVYSLHHPDMFAACAAFSAAVRTDEEMLAMDQTEFNNRFAALYGDPGNPKERLGPNYRKNSVLDLLKNLKDSDKDKVRFMIDCGDDDFLYRGNSAMHVLMRDLNIPHEYRVRDGSHSWIYWRSGITSALQFIGESFKR